MNVLTDTFRGVVRRRLWPVALLLIAALVAVPKLLAKQPETPPAPAAPVAAVKTGADDPATAPTLVSATDDAQGGRRRYVLGARKDPFEPAPLPKAKRQAKTKTAAKRVVSAVPTATPAPSNGGSSSGGSSGGGSTPPTSTPPVATIPMPSKPSYPADSLKVNFGLTSGTLTSRTLRVRQALPSPGHPLVVYMGLEDHGKTAVFMVGSDVKVLEGDGRCDGDCTELRLKAGDTEFINTNPTTSNPKGDQYELDLLKIHASAKAKKASSSKKTASAAKSAAAVWGRAARRAPRPHIHF